MGGRGDCRAAGDSKCSLRCAAVIAAGSAWPSAGAGRAVRDRRDHREAIARDTPPESRFAFWVTGIALFTLWNLGTLAGALATHAIPDPKALGLDAAPPAAFLALLAPRLREREPMAIALGAGVVALVVVPFVPAGIPLLIVATLVALFGVFRGGAH